MRRTLLISATAFCLVLHGTAGRSQDAPAQATNETVTLQTVAVTGTHIRSADTATEHPLVVLERSDLERTGQVAVADIVQALIVANGHTLNRNINNGGNGELRVNLRSLGENRTLVLVDGQRWVSTIDGAVDLSVIPLAIVERIEVLKDGASAVYGSDAIGGVINIITRKRFDAAELGVTVGQSDRGDGANHQIDASFGRSGESWSAVVGVEYGKDDPIMASARAISATPAFGLPLGATGSGASQYGAFYIGDFDCCHRYRLIPGRPGTSPDDFRRIRIATDLDYNFVPYNYLRTPQEHTAGYGRLQQVFSPTLSLSLDALFDQRKSAQQLAPPVVLFSPDPFSGGFEVAPDNLYNPFGSSVSVITRWPDDLPRRFEQAVNTTRLHVGLDGLSDAFGRNWAWNLDATRTQSHKSEFASPYADNAKLALAVGPSFYDANGAARCGTPENVIADCVPLDLFTGPGRFTQAMLDYVDVAITNRAHGRSDAISFTTSTSLAELDAGSLGFAAGLERRLERGSDEPDPLLAAGRANGTSVTFDATRGGYSVNEAYAELDVPLLADKPLARELDVNLATRFSDYSQFGRTDNSRVGLRWKPADDLLLRSTWAQGFRAPSIYEAFGGAVNVQADYTYDNCAANPDYDYVPPPVVAANCAANGVPTDIPLYSNFATATYGSNPHLKPEIARSLTAGFVYSPNWISGLDASLDWYRIQIRDAIGSLGTQAVLDACYIAGDPVACSRIVRNADGTLQHIIANLQNIPGGIQTEGWDFALAWKHPTRLGDIALRWDNAYVSYWGDIGKPARGAALPDGSLAQGNVVGTNNALYGVIWRLRSVATLAWQRGAWSASISARYFSPIQEDCDRVVDVADAVQDPALRALCSDPDHIQDGSPAPRDRVGAVTYTDLQTSWRAPWKGLFTLGVRNALDRNAPVSHSYNTYANSFYSDYDIPGRFVYASYRQPF